MKLLIVGAGLAGAVLARQLKSHFDITVIDERNHVAGNCHTEIDEDTKILKHVYGCHIFHTDKESVWDFVNKFSKFAPFTLRVKANLGGKVVSLPINLSTINDIHDCNLTPKECSDFMASIVVDIKNPKNFEEQALAIVGEKIYNLLFKGYTEKQWGVDPKLLPASIIKRLPIRSNYNDAYFNDEFQAMPLHGYTKMVSSMLDKPNVNVLLGTKYDESMMADYDHVVFTGAIDQFYDYKFGKLGYRTVYWKDEVHEGDYQGTALMTYPNSEDFTRIVEHKHFSPWRTSPKTIISKEYSKQTESGDIPYYPVRLAKDKKTMGKYIVHAIKSNSLSDTRVSFLGRLATYRYMDMHNVIHESMQFAKLINRRVYSKLNSAYIPTFPVDTAGLIGK